MSFTKYVQHKANGKKYKAEVFEAPSNHFFTRVMKAKLTGTDGQCKVVKLDTIFKNYKEIKEDDYNDEL